MSTNPLWLDGIEGTVYPALDADLKVDVLVIGGGITGVGAAQALARAGRNVALVERSRLGGGDTAHTTAHLTYMTDTRLSDLVRVCGEESAKAAWEAGKVAMDHIRDVVSRLGVDVGLTEVPGYLVAALDADLTDEVPRLRDEADMATRMGFDVEFLDRIPPTDQPGIRFHGQMKFHPLLYLQALAKDACDAGALFFEETNVSEFGEGHVIANGHRIDYSQVVIATHVPLQGSRGTLAAALFQTKISSYSTYAIAASGVSRPLEEMIWSDTADPFHYLRVDGDSVIFGGEDHKTGQVSGTGSCYVHLEKSLRRKVGDFTVTHRWCGQVVETVDGLPYIGETAPGEFIATGFSGNGMTLGTAAALMIRDKILGLSNPWDHAFDPGRVQISATTAYLAENKDFPYLLVKDRAAVPKGDPMEIPPGEGKVIKVEGKRIAVFCDPDGMRHEMSAVCPHLGCIVGWNAGEQTWDCPCHGSRFAADGGLIAGPAENGLEVLTPA